MAGKAPRKKSSRRRRNSLASSSSSSSSSSDSSSSSSSSDSSSSDSDSDSDSASASASDTKSTKSSAKSARGRRCANPFPHQTSAAAQEWKRRKRDFGDKNKVIDKLMKYEGLDEVKQQFIDIAAKAELAKVQGRRLRAHERFNAVFQGNPGTGKTTVARLYAALLRSVRLLKSDTVKEMSGTEIGMSDARETKTKIDDLLDDGGGVLFVDEAYQLTASYAGGSGRQALDVILTAMENNIGKLAVVFVGYRDEMEAFHEHNPGLASRIPYALDFADFSDGQLWKMFCDNLRAQFKGRMRVEGGLDGLYVRIAIRRLAQARGRRGFGNARAVQNLLARISGRQAQRLAREQLARGKKGKKKDCFMLTTEDLIGPDPVDAVRASPAWAELQALVGLEAVKDSARSMMRMIQLNYRRELDELKPLTFPLNQVFVGAPGTGKTTVAKLYGRILADLGLLSRGDVVMKNPSDFMGSCLGESENKTRRILDATVGKVLVIDEAYMLDAGSGDTGSNQQRKDSFKSDVIDTMVAVVQGTPGEDRCIILVGYEDKITDMFRNVNPGLARRFPISRPFRFDNFSLAQLELILAKKLGEQDLRATPAALAAARAVFERGLMRPDFTNAGEVDSALAAAKMNYEMRQSKAGASGVVDGLLEPQDFDKDFARGGAASAAAAAASEAVYRATLQGLVHDTIIDKLAGYQRRCANAHRQGLDPRKLVPTNFVFSGHAGTGKTTAAQHMGRLFYDMGFLATADVVECTATDLIGQYIGQTAPKARRQLEQGLGKVLIVDDAPRLAPQGGAHFAAEALDELVHFLNRPAHAGRVVVVLAGDVEGMQALLARQPALAGLFTEHVVFDHIPPADCLAMLERELARSHVAVEAGALANAASPANRDAESLLRTLQTLPGWSNARDVKQLAQRVLGAYLETAPAPAEAAEDVVDVDVVDVEGEAATARRVPADVVLVSLRGLVEERQARAAKAKAEPGKKTEERADQEPAVAYREDEQTKTEIHTTHKVNEAKHDHREEEESQAGGKKMQDVQQALRAMGRCVMGFAWHREGSGWQCDGGSHFVTDAELSKYMG
ncbi:P-loop containing nucleoside triphosphate hydrolase protein [Lasiosphaeria miniovina]|uniref:P-loop containing nucleoside triphosphate hydrolase protein n=1 Tax=Lasiosphaeria miniovina TaxID=1954250 RepID=A0AA40DLA2_9PEZI|nr:P-loop containing nucleoside triphosphate hydrolase protein [Lasiosphaeria miniovina]KAK0704013.1 P-loop containing nucleoside triphosphate hydrolase protein [Lasiosphaeria miniovina]